MTVTAEPGLAALTDAELVETAKSAYVDAEDAEAEAGSPSRWKTADSYRELNGRGWTQQKIAKSCAVSQSNVSFYIKAAEYYPGNNRPLFAYAYKEVKSASKTEAVRTTAAPTGLFSVVYADPPWDYGSKLDGYGPAENHYPTLSLKALCELRFADERSVREVCADDSVLFLWVTSPQLDISFEVIKAWGFTYKTSFVWDKVKHNFGHYNSVRHEFLLVATRGAFTPQMETLKLHDSVVSIERSGKHSEKPEFFRQVIDELYPSGRRLELFARTKVDGWDSWGSS